MTITFMSIPLKGLRVEVAAENAKAHAGMIVGRVAIVGILHGVFVSAPAAPPTTHPLHPRERTAGGGVLVAGGRCGAAAAVGGHRGPVAGGHCAEWRRCCGRARRGPRGGGGGDEEVACRGNVS